MTSGQMRVMGIAIAIAIIELLYAPNVKGDARSLMSQVIAGHPYQAYLAGGDIARRALLFMISLTLLLLLAAPEPELASWLALVILAGVVLSYGNQIAASITTLSGSFGTSAGPFNRPPDTKGKAK